MIKQLYKSLGTIFRDIGDQLTYQSARAYLISGRKNYNNGKFKKAVNLHTASCVASRRIRTISIVRSFFPDFLYKF